MSRFSHHENEHRKPTVYAFEVWIHISKQMLWEDDGLFSISENHFHVYVKKPWNHSTESTIYSQRNETTILHGVMGRWNFRGRRHNSPNCQAARGTSRCPALSMSSCSSNSVKSFLPQLGTEFLPVGATLRTWQPWCTSHGFGSIFVSTQK